MFEPDDHGDELLILSFFVVDYRTSERCIVLKYECVKKEYEKSCAE